jgi:ADP-ribose pyrophosphatase
VRQYRHAAGLELLELPAGTRNPQEDPAASANRELREEIGMRADRLTLLGGFFLAPGYATEYMHIFLAEELHPDRLPGDEDEILLPEKIPWSKVEAMIGSGEFQDAKTVAALALAMRFRNSSGKPN